MQGVRSAAVELASVLAVFDAVLRCSFCFTPFDPNFSFLRALADCCKVAL
jgi:hypothetical protein